jgi:hypothetical protein
MNRALQVKGSPGWAQWRARRGRIQEERSSRLYCYSSHSYCCPRWYCRCPRCWGICHGSAPPSPRRRRRWRVEHRDRYSHSHHESIRTASYDDACCRAYRSSYDGGSRSHATCRARLRTSPRCSCRGCSRCGRSPCLESLRLALPRPPFSAGGSPSAQSIMTRSP